MFRYKVFSLIFSTCILFVLSTENPVTRNVLELDQVENNSIDINLDKFLAGASADYLVTRSNLRQVNLKGAPITIGDCMPDSILKITRTGVTPPEVEKGTSIHMVAQGIFREERDVTNIHVEVTLNGQEIYRNDVQKKGHASKGPYTFSYDNNVPTFVPSGQWNVNVWLMGGNEKLACIRATFTVA